MSTSASETSSSALFPQYRLKRKPPPTINIAEKYPSPDPQDPFAPLWVLRNRTSSALGQNPLATKDTPSPYSQPPHHKQQGPLGGKPDSSKVSSALNSIPIERRRSNSHFSPQSATTTTNAIPPRSSSVVPPTSIKGLRMLHGFNRSPSQSGTTTVGVTSHPLVKLAHPQANSDSTQRSNAMSHTDGQRNDPHIVHPQPRAAGNMIRRLTTVDTRTADNGSGNETESDLSMLANPSHRKRWVGVKVKSIDVESQEQINNAALTTTISFNVGVDVKPTLLRRATSNGTTSTGSASLAKSAPPTSQQSRLAKFWLPKKASHDGYMADGEKRSGKNARPNQKGPLHKLSISAPLTDTFVHEGRSRSQQSRDDDYTTSSARNPGRSRGDTSDTDFEENTGGVRLRGVLFKARKKSSTGNVPVGAIANSTSERAEAVIPQPAVVDKPEHTGNKEIEKRRPELSWAEVNMDEYYTPVTNPRGSYPTPSPSPQLKPARELEPEILEDEKVNPSKAQAPPRVKKFKPTRPPGSGLLPATTTGVHSPPTTSVPPSSSTSTTSSTPIPPPPPKMFKSCTSSPTPAQTSAEATSSASPNEPAQLASPQAVSSTSIINKLSELPSNEDACAFAKPRRAPRPLPTVDGVQSEPEPFKREGYNDLRKEERRSRKGKKDGGEIISSKVEPKSDDGDHVLRRQNMDATVKETRVLEVAAKAPVPAVKHGKAASTDFGTRKDKGVGLTGGSGDVASKKAAVPVSSSTPARLSSKESAGGCFPQLQASRPIFHPKGASPDSSFNAFGVPSTEYNLPTRTQLAQAASLPVYAEDGRKHSFGSLFENQKTVVIFIRHFWCPLCQNYMSVVKSTVTPDMLVADGWVKDEDEIVWKNERGYGGSSDPPVERIGFVIISNDAHGMIAKYRQIVKLPFRVYTDSSLAIYKLLGMGKTGAGCQDHHNHPTNYMSDSPAPPMPKKKHNYSLRRKADTSVSSLSDREKDQGGGYVKHGLMSGIAMVVVKAFKVGMPVWEKGGDVGQLGGEFVLGPGLICTYAHKMQSSKGHAPIEEVLQAAGVKLRNTGLPPRPSSPKVLNPQFPPTSKQEPAQRQTESIDLSSPPRPPKPPKELRPLESVRNRKESFNGMQETVPPSRSSTQTTSVATAKSISHPRPRGPSQRGERERRHDPSPIPTSVTSHKIVPALPPAFAAVMTREEETRWAEERQKSIERAIQERGNNVRRVGALGRTSSSQGQGGGSARSTQGNAGGGYVVQPVVAKEGRGMTESRSAPTRVLDEEKIVYKAEGRRVKERTRGYEHHGSGSGYVQRGSTSTTATPLSRR